jgi:hypothetical protein
VAGSVLRVRCWWNKSDCWSRLFLVILMDSKKRTWHSGVEDGLVLGKRQTVVSQLPRVACPAASACQLTRCCRSRRSKQPEMGRRRRHGDRVAWHCIVSCCCCCALGRSSCRSPERAGINPSIHLNPAEQAAGTKCPKTPECRRLGLERGERQEGSLGVGRGVMPALLCIKCR